MEKPKINLLALTTIGLFLLLAWVFYQGSRPGVELGVILLIPIAFVLFILGCISLIFWLFAIKSNSKKSIAEPSSIAESPISAGTKKWYKDKDIISLIIPTLIAVALIGLYFLGSSYYKEPVQSLPSLAQCKSESTDKQGECFRQYGETTKDINACKAIAVYPNDVACAIGVAVALNNVKICDQVSDFLSYEAPQYGVQGCYDGYAAETKDVQICASLSGSNTFQTQFEKDTCYSGIATTLLDPSYCSYLSNVHSQDECYETIGEQKLDITICDKIIEGDVANNELKGDCYLKIAVSTKNSSICDKIIFFPNSQLACYQLLNVTPPPSASSTLPQATNPTSTTSQQNITPSTFGSVDFTLDSLEATGTPKQSIQFTGKIVNNTDQVVYLNGLSGNLSYSELTFDSSPFFKLPASLKPGESASGVIFAVATSQIALPGDYTGSVQVQGGSDVNASNILGDETFVIHVTK